MSLKKERSESGSSLKMVEYIPVIMFREILLWVHWLILDRQHERHVKHFLVSI